MVFQSFNKRSFLITIKKKLQCLILFKCWTLLLSKKKPDHYFSFTSRNENFLDQKVYLFYLKSLQSKNVILLYDFINFMNFGDGQFWFYEIIVCNILVEPPLTPRLKFSKVTCDLHFKFRTIGDYR